MDLIASTKEQTAGSYKTSDSWCGFTASAWRTDEGRGKANAMVPVVNGAKRTSRTR